MDDLDGKGTQQKVVGRAKKNAPFGTFFEYRVLIKSAGMGLERKIAPFPHITNVCPVGRTASSGSWPIDRSA